MVKAADDRPAPFAASRAQKCIRGKRKREGEREGGRFRIVERGVRYGTRRGESNSVSD